MKVRLFAALREIAGTSLLEVDAPDVGSMLDQLSERFGPEFDRIMARLRNGEKLEPLETVRHRKDGRKIVVSLAVSPLRDGAGRLDEGLDVRTDPEGNFLRLELRGSDPARSEERRVGKEC